MANPTLPPRQVNPARSPVWAEADADALVAQFDRLLAGMKNYVTAYGPRDDVAQELQAQLPVLRRLRDLIETTAA